MKLKFLIVLAICISFLSCNKSNNLSKESIEKILKENNFHGSILVVKNNRTIIDKGYGYANVKTKLKNNTDNQFLVGSISKPITSIAIMKLKESGLIKLNDKLSKYLDYPNADKITIDMLLKHKTGYSRYIKFVKGKIILPEGLGLPKTYEIKELLKLIKPNLDFSDPGKNYIYSNINYLILAKIIEDVSGEKYGDYINNNIFQPLHMKSTAHSPDYFKELSNKAIPYDNKDYTESIQINLSEMIGFGSVKSSVKDLKKLSDAIKDSSLLQENFIDSSKKYINEHNGVFKVYLDEDENRYLGHGGVYFGSSSYILIGLNNNLTIIISGNRNSYQTILNIVKRISGNNNITPL